MKKVSILALFFLFALSCAKDDGNQNSGNYNTNSNANANTNNPIAPLVGTGDPRLKTVAIVIVDPASEADQNNAATQIIVAPPDIKLKLDRANPAYSQLVEWEVINNKETDVKVVVNGFKNVDPTQPSDPFTDPSAPASQFSSNFIKPGTEARLGGSANSTAKNAGTYKYNVTIQLSDGRLIVLDPRVIIDF